MLRSALAAAFVVAFPTFAAEPVPRFAAEGQQIKLAVIQGDGMDWAEATFRVTTCIAGSCSVRQHVKVLAPLATWKVKHGQTVGLVRYAWKDDHGGPRSWVLALRLDDADENDRFVRDGDRAAANARDEPDDAAVATR